MSSSSVRVENRPDAIAILSIDQQDSKVNILSRELWQELRTAVDSLAQMPEIRGLVIASAKPGVFIAGADLKLLANASAPNDPAVREFIELGLRVLDQLESLPFPTCAAINGVALGGGLEVTLACDYRIAGVHPKTLLGLPEVKLGLMPGWGGTQRLPRLIGMEKAAEMLFGGGSLTATEAEAVGLVGVEAVPDLVDRAAKFLLEVQNATRTEGSLDWHEVREDKWAPIPDFLMSEITLPDDASPASKEIRSVLLGGVDLPLAEAIHLETKAFLRLAGSQESNRLIAEFFASRKR